MRERIKVIVLPLVAWCKANFVAILVTILLGAAAIWSITYAYLNGRSQPTPIAVAETLQLDAQHQTLAHTDDRSDHHAADSDGSTVNSSSETHSEESATGVGNSVQQVQGVEVNCEIVEAQARKKLDKTVGGLSQPLTSQDNKTIQEAFNEYKHIVVSDGCTAELTLSDVHAGLKYSLPSVPGVL